MLSDWDWSIFVWIDNVSDDTDSREQLEIVMCLKYNMILRISFYRYLFWCECRLYCMLLYSMLSQYWPLNRAPINNLPFLRTGQCLHSGYALFGMMFTWTFVRTKCWRSGLYPKTHISVSVFIWTSHIQEMHWKMRASSKPKCIGKTFIGIWYF